MRGVIVSEANGRLIVELQGEETVEIAPNEVTNYSLAARRAWAAMPKKAGRPRLDTSGKKKMVSLRIDADLWERLGQAVEAGLIPNRGQAVNTWLREQLDLLLGEEQSGGRKQGSNVANERNSNGYQTR
jgi:uncharacterized protein (DUF4415 family)